jgi:hypothetical protein
LSVWKSWSWAVVVMIVSSRGGPVVRSDLDPRSKVFLVQ